MNLLNEANVPENLKTVPSVPMQKYQNIQRRSNEERQQLQSIVAKIWQKQFAITW